MECIVHVTKQSNKSKNKTKSYLRTLTGELCSFTTLENIFDALNKTDFAKSIGYYDRHISASRNKIKASWRVSYIDDEVFSITYQFKWMSSKKVNRIKEKINEQRR